MARWAAHGLPSAHLYVRVGIYGAYRCARLVEAGGQPRVSPQKLTTRLIFHWPGTYQQHWLLIWFLGFEPCLCVYKVSTVWTELSHRSLEPRYLST